MRKEAVTQKGRKQLLRREEDGYLKGEDCITQNRLVKELNELFKDTPLSSYG